MIDKALAGQQVIQKDQRAQVLLGLAVEKPWQPDKGMRTFPALQKRLHLGAIVGRAVVFFIERKVDEHPPLIPARAKRVIV